MKTNFYEKYQKIKIEGLPKYVQLREAIRAAIDDGYWEAGSQLPPEVVIARSVPFSLGTVQKALQALVEEGVVIRRQGYGTFVVENHQQMDRPWHCRFASDEEGSFLPVYPKVVLRTRIKGKELWVKLLNKDSDEIIQIDRLMDIGHEFFVYIRFFLNGVKYDAFLEKPVEELESSNFKSILRQEYNLPITEMAYTLRIDSLPDEICKAIEVSEGTVGLVYEIVANSGPKSPVYYQEIFIPPNKRKLYISDSSNIPQYWT